MSNKRMEDSKSFKKIAMKFGGYQLRYAWVSQRGFYPEEPNKANQDSHVEVENFCSEQGVEDMHLFGVFDGHGKTGDLCAQWARDHLPVELAACLKAYPDDIERCFKESFVKVNNTLHESNVDDRMSGTTAIVVLVYKGTIHVANVGDSRAIIAQQQDSHLKAYSLSQDQTPFRKDERERCKRAGAQIATMDQLEGLEPMHENWGDTAETGGEEGDGDPPRVWIPNQMSPGCAFTRSIGDQVGESVGVFAEVHMPPA